MLPLLPPKVLPVVAPPKANGCIPEVAAGGVWAIIAPKGFAAAAIPPLPLIPKADPDPIPAEDACAPKLNVGRLLEVFEFVTGADRLDPSPAMSIDGDSLPTKPKLLTGWLTEKGPTAAVEFDLKPNELSSDFVNFGFQSTSLPPLIPSGLLPKGAPIEDTEGAKEGAVVALELKADANAFVEDAPKLVEWKELAAGAAVFGALNIPPVVTDPKVGSDTAVVVVAGVMDENDDEALPKDGCDPNEVDEPVPNGCVITEDDAGAPVVVADTPKGCTVDVPIVDS